MRDADFERLYGQHAEPLFAFLAYRTGDRVLAEDLLADTFERALRARRRFDRRRGSEKSGRWRQPAQRGSCAVVIGHRGRV